MSWSISLSGPKQMVAEELDAAITALQAARNVVYGCHASAGAADGETVAVSASGSASLAYNDNSSVGASFYVSTSKPPQPPAAVEETVDQVNQAAPTV